MKINIVSWNGASPVGGLERVVYYQKKILDEKYEVRLITLDDVYQHKIIKYFSFLKGNPVVNSLFTSFYLKQSIGKNEFLITHGYNAALTKADILCIHGNWIGYENAIGVDKKSIKRVMGLLEKWAGKRAKKMIAVTKDAKEQWNNFYHLNSDKINVLNNCVDTEIFRVIPQGKKEGINILFCGRLSHGKGVEKLLDLAHYIETEENHYTLTIVTPSNRNIELFSCLSKTKILVGVSIENLPQFYNSGDVFFFPSLYEGFEMVTTESLSCGTPVVGNNVGAIKELFSQKLKGISIINEGSTQQLIEQLNDIARQYMDLDKKTQLHDQMVNACGIQTYKHKFLKLCGL